MQGLLGVGGLGGLADGSESGGNIILSRRNRGVMWLELPGQQVDLVGFGAVVAVKSRHRGQRGVGGGGGVLVSILYA